MKSYKLYVELLYTKEVQAESYDDAIALAEDGTFDDFFEWECVVVQENAEELQPRCDEGDAPPRGLV
tara:strand:+ start:1420 stop:1620 length:201 start_codon:yes stop_codon:yes gene_type:complete